MPNTNCFWETNFREQKQGVIFSCFSHYLVNTCSKHKWHAKILGKEKYVYTYLFFISRGLSLLNLITYDIEMTVLHRIL